MGFWHGSIFHLGCRHYSAYLSVERPHPEKVPPAAESGLYGGGDSRCIDKGNCEPSDAAQMATRITWYCWKFMDICCGSKISIS